MKKIRFLLLLLLINNSFAQDIPDPTVDIIDPPMGLPQISNNERIFIPVNKLDFQGVLIMEDESKNKTFFNGSSYELEDVLDDLWVVTTINKKQVVLKNKNTKETKIFKSSGD